MSSPLGRDSGNRGKVRLIVMNVMRLTLIVALVLGILNGRRLILIFAALGLFVTFIPAIVSGLFGRKLPAGYEIVMLMFAYGLIYFGEVRGVFDKIWLIGAMLTLVASMIFGFIGFAVLSVLHKENKISTSALMISAMTFCFAVTIGALWEVFEFSLSSFFGFNLGTTSDKMTQDIATTMLGALIVSGAGYFYIKSGKNNLVSAVVERAVRKYPGIFGSTDNEPISERTKRLIAQGEGKNVEFKSTLRTNLHTNQLDKNMEHSALKTIVGYLNSDGGTLVIGVENDGKISGMQRDNFPNHDHLSLHFSNLVKEHIGHEFLPFIEYNIVDVDGKHVLKVDCKKSPKQVFLKMGKEEQFYVRHGPSTMSLQGSALVDYIVQRFGV